MWRAEYVKTSYYPATLTVVSDRAKLSTSYYKQQRPSLHLLVVVLSLPQLFIMV